MKKLLIMSLVVAFTIVTMAIAQDKGPAIINLKAAWDVTGNKEAVNFDHAKHQENNKCTDCHATEAGGKFTPKAEIKGTNDKNGAHAICWPCHVEKKVPSGKTCTKCHKKS